MGPVLGTHAPSLLTVGTLYSRPGERATSRPRPRSQAWLTLLIDVLSVLRQMRSDGAWKILVARIGHRRASVTAEACIAWSHCRRQLAPAAPWGSRRAHPLRADDPRRKLQAYLDDIVETREAT